MSAVLQSIVSQPYKHGFVTNIESDVAPKGLNEDTIRMISAKKNEPEWLLEFRLKSYAAWLKMEEPTWPNVHFPKIDYQEGLEGAQFVIKNPGAKSTCGCGSSFST